MSEWNTDSQHTLRGGHESLAMQRKTLVSMIVVMGVVIVYYRTEYVPMLHSDA